MVYRLVNWYSINSSGNILGLNLVDRAYEIWSSDIRYIGVGSMVVGGIASIFKVRNGLINAINILKDNQKSS